FFSVCYRAHPDLHSFPTRRSSDLAVLLAHFDSLDALLERIDEVPFLRFRGAAQAGAKLRLHRVQALLYRQLSTIALDAPLAGIADRKSTRLNSSHVKISYAVFCLK